jgi:hypothetical protein
MKTAYFTTLQTFYSTGYYTLQGELLKRALFEKIRLERKRSSHGQTLADRTNPGPSFQL